MLIRKLSSIAVALCALGFARQASAQATVQYNGPTQMQTVPIQQQPPPPQYNAPPPQYGSPPPQQYQQQTYGVAPGYARNEGVDRAGGVIGGILGFGAHAGSGFALGVEGGYTLPMHLYLGGNFTYFVGSDDVSAYLFEFQVGYDLGVIRQAPVLIRPYIGLGYENFSVTVPAGCGAFCPSSVGSFVITPGVMGAYFFTPHWYAGADLRLDIATASGEAFTVFDLFATGGYKF
jgi:hypothetical protein